VLDWDDCAAIPPADLDAPLGDRTVIDLGTGRPIDRIDHVPG